MYIFNSFYLLHSYNPSFLICLCFNMVSFSDQKKLGPRPDRSPDGFNSKFPTSIPTPFICGFPPSPGVTGPQKLAIIGALRCGGDPAKIRESNLSK